MSRWVLALLLTFSATAGCADYTLDGEWRAGASSPTPTPSGTATPNPDSGVFFWSDFEQNDGGLTHQGFSAPDTWEWGTGEDPAYSGVRMWDTNLQGDYADSEDSCLVLALTLPAGAMWWRSRVRYGTEEGSDPMSLLVCPPGAGSGGGSGCDVVETRDGASNGFIELLEDLSPYAGTDRELRWCMKDDGIIQDPGVSVDDVAVATSAGLATLP